MFDSLEKLRSKPDRAKKRFAFLIALLVVAIIFSVWLTVLYPEFRNDQNKVEQVSKLEPSPFGAFTDSVGNAFSSISQTFGELRQGISSFTTSPAYYISSSTNQ